MNLGKIAIIAAMLAVCRISAFGSQDRYQNGIYLTEGDFKSDILSFPSLSDNDSLVEASAGDIHLVRDGKTIQFRFSEFYGYRDRGYKFFSFGKKRIFKTYGYYQILDDSPLYIYNKRVPHVQYHYVQAPYFSLSLDARKYKLTRKNLKKYARLTSGAEKKIESVRDRHSLAAISHGRCMVNDLILTSKD